jgi:hypothetical protein
MAAVHDQVAPVMKQPTDARETTAFATSSSGLRTACRNESTDALGEARVLSRPPFHSVWIHPRGAGLIRIPSRAHLGPASS